MTLSIVASFVILGLLLILIEIFIVPGFIVGIVGFVMVVVGVYYTYNDHGKFYANILLALIAVVMTIVVVYAFRNGAWDMFSNKETISGKANDIQELEIKIGDTGKTISALRPSGIADINNQRVEVHSEGSFIPSGAEVEVNKIIKNKIYIKIQ
ncbi:MAG: NfeD family protein [Bacteroidia bacterium]|nr:NfeD family protein [Bacteroidia bacterium]|tara:strand:- start:51 stop:512 length:462 start_codon:yes stop_codon:yes gene_type:complete